MIFLTRCSIRGLRSVQAFVLSGVLTVLFVGLPGLACAQAGATASESLEAARSASTSSGMLGEPQRIEADVGAATPLTKIVLHYRFGNDEDYRQLPMREGGTPGLYVANVPTSGVRAVRMDYFVIAEDTGGAVLGKGSASEPLVRELRAPVSTDATGSVPPPAGSPAAEQQPIVSNRSQPAEAGESDTFDAPATQGNSNTMKYVYYGLGILAVGALAAAASGGGDSGGDSGSGCAPEGCSITVVAPDP